MGILISDCSLEVYTEAVFPNRGHWCACPSGISGLNHLDGKWVGLSARLASPKKSPAGISHLPGGCSVPLWLQSVLQTSVSERKTKELETCHLPLMGQAMPISDWRPCPCSGNQRDVWCWGTDALCSHGGAPCSF